MSSRQVITATFAVETSALDAGDVANAAVIEFPVAGYGVGKIDQLVIIDNDHQTAANVAGALWLFSSTVTPAAADAAHSISDADAAKLIGIIPVASTDCLLSALNTACVVRLNPPLMFDLGGGTSIYGIYVITATPTFAGGSMTMKLGVS